MGRKYIVRICVLSDARLGERRHVTRVKERWLSGAIGGRTWWFTGKADKM
jgi:hypothetical protein